MRTTIPTSIEYLSEPRSRFYYFVPKDLGTHACGWEDHDKIVLGVLKELKLRITFPFVPQSTTKCRRPSSNSSSQPTFSIASQLFSVMETGQVVSPGSPAGPKRCVFVR